MGISLLALIIGDHLVLVSGWERGAATGHQRTFEDKRWRCIRINWDVGAGRVGCLREVLVRRMLCIGIVVGYVLYQGFDMIRQLDTDATNVSSLSFKRIPVCYWKGVTILTGIDSREALPLRVIFRILYWWSHQFKL